MLKVMVLDSDLKSVQETRDAVQCAKEAQAKFSSFSQEKVDYIIQKVAEAAFKESKSLAKMAVEETGMGIVEHKTMKNELCSRDLYESIKDEKTIGILNEDHQNRITEIAYPFGVIACIIPTTNPTSTAIFKSIISLKTLNAIVVSPHPNAFKCTIEALKVCNQAAVEAGAPEGLINWISEPTMAATKELMHHKDVNLILATGGGGLVKAAYSSGKPAYGVGPGNTPVYLEKTANVKKSVQMIIDSKTFDNGTICSTEQAIVVDQNIKKMTIRELKNNGAYFLNESEKAKLEQVISPIKGQLNPKIVGRSPAVIGKMAGIQVPESARVLIAEETKVAKDVPFSIEKLSPIFPLYTVRSEEEAKRLCYSLLENGGKGHTMSLHTNDDKVAKSFGVAMPVSRLMVNTLSSIGAAGATSGLMPSMTLGCGSYGGNITSDNITARHLINIKSVAYGTIDVTIPQPSKFVKESNKIFVDSNLSNTVDSIIQEVLKEVNNQEIFDSDKVSEAIKNVVKQTDYENNNYFVNSDALPGDSMNSFPGTNRSVDDTVNQVLKEIDEKKKSMDPEIVSQIISDVLNKS